MDNEQYQLEILKKKCKSFRFSIKMMQVIHEILHRSSNVSPLGSLRAFCLDESFGAIFLPVPADDFGYFESVVGVVSTSLNASRLNTTTQQNFVSKRM